MSAYIFKKKKKYMYVLINYYEKILQEENQKMQFMYFITLYNLCAKQFIS